MKETLILRALAIQYKELLSNANNAEKYHLYKAMNDNKMIRPVVLIDEMPWHEMGCKELTNPICDNSFLGEIELYLRRKIFQYEKFPADMILPEYVPVDKVIHHSGIGVEIQEEVIKQGKDSGISAHSYCDQLRDDEAVDKLHNQVVTYDKIETNRRLTLISEILDGILPVKLMGLEQARIGTWDLISELRGMDNMLIDLIDDPEFTHRIVRKLTDIQMNTLLQYEKLGLFERNPQTIHCTTALSDDLKVPSDGSNPKLEHVWGRGVAQIFSTVGSEMHDEFDIQYMNETIGRCGLVYYGCCEPLDKKIDIVEKIDNLRKISITPWANVNIAAEAINGRYVIAAKPNPANVAVGKLDEEYVKKEILEILDACYKNSCSVEFTLKDISTCGNNLNNILRWEQMVMDIVKHY